MAEAVVALGAAAAAVQFVEQAASITVFFYQTFSKIKDAPELVQKNLAQIEQLISISRLIIANAALQTESIASLLADILRDATQLQNKLTGLTPSPDAGRFEKFKKSFESVLKEDGIEKIFTRLDRHKASLTIAMNEIDSSLLHTIGIQITAAQTTAGDMLLVINDTHRDIQTLLNAMPGISSDISTVYAKSAELSDKLTSLDDHLSTVLSFVKTNQEAMLAAVSGCSQNATGIFDVPTRRARPFVGREDMLTLLSQGLTKKSRIANCAVLRGLGGQGKSRIALEYSLRSRNSPYKTTFWIDATSKHTIQKAFELFYRKFRIKSDEMLDEIEAIISFVKQSLESMSKPWLIVFDNYDSPASVDIEEYMPLNQNGSIIVTSRHTEVKNLASAGLAIELDALIDTDAINLLLDSATIEKDQSSEHCAKQIVAHLSNHALAVVQTGAYIRKSKIPFSEFLDYYNRHRKDVLSRGVPAAEYDRKLKNEPTSLDVFATWELSLLQLKAENGSKEFKEDILTIFGFCNGQDISEELFKNFCDNMEPWSAQETWKVSPGAFLADRLKCWDSGMFSELLAEFYDLALIQGYELLDDGFYHVSIHPLVKDWIQLRKDQTSAIEYRILVTEILIEYLNPSSSQQAGHSIISAGILSKVDSNFEGAVTADASTDVRNLSTNLLEVNESLAALLESSGHYQQAEQLHRQVLHAVEKFYGQAHLETVKAKYYLGVSLHWNGRHVETQTLLQSILDQSCRFVGINGELTKLIRIGLASSKGSVGQAAEGEVLMEQQLALDQKDWGESSKVTVADYGKLITMYRQQGKITSCESACRRILHFADTHVDCKEQWLLDCLYDAAIFFHETWDLQKARNIFKRVFESQCANFRRQHPRALRILRELTHVEMNLGYDLYECEILFREVAESFAHFVSPDHPDMLFNAFPLGDCLFRQGKKQEAEIHVRLFTDGCIRAQLNNSNIYHAGLRLLCVILRDQGKWDSAEVAAQDALEIISQSYEPTQPEYIKAVEMLQSIREMAARAQETPSVLPEAP